MAVEHSGVFEIKYNSRTKKNDQLEFGQWRSPFHVMNCTNTNQLACFTEFYRLVTWLSLVLFWVLLVFAFCYLQKTDKSPHYHLGNSYKLKSLFLFFIFFWNLFCIIFLVPQGTLAISYCSWIAGIYMQVFNMTA